MKPRIRHVFRNNLRQRNFSSYELKQIKVYGRALVFFFMTYNCFEKLRTSRSKVTNDESTSCKLRNLPGFNSGSLSFLTVIAIIQCHTAAQLIKIIVHALKK